MGKINYRPVYNRSKRLNAEGKALLQVEAYLSRKKVYFSTHIYLVPKQWNRKKRMVVNHPQADYLNYLLRDFVMKLEQQEMELWKEGTEVTPDALKRRIHPRKEHSFLAFVEESITATNVKESTRKNLKTTWKLLGQFKDNLKAEELTSGFLHDFEVYMYRKGLETNTVAKHMKQLRIFVNWAIDKGMMDGKQHPFRRYRIRTSESKHTYLFPEEVQKLEELDLKGRNRSLEQTLDAFLFCCYTGLRYSDFTALKDKNVVEIEGRRWLDFRSVKTGVEVKLPLYLLFEGKAWRLLEKYRGKWASFFELKSNACVNHDLRLVGQLAGIGKRFSFHAARHTNATLLIYKGANITTVQKLLGHRNIATTQLYAEIMGETIVKDLEGCEDSCLHPQQVAHDAVRNEDSRGGKP